MRKSNVRYTKGSIIFVKNTVAAKYLIRRPCIIVSNPTHIMGSYIVCCCGTQDHPGIKISLYNDEKKRYIGERKFSNIYPYNLFSISAGDIRCCIGQLDPFIMNAVDKAIDFHLGRTTEIPGYLKGWEDKLFGVQYHMMNASDIYESDLNPLEDVFEDNESSENTFTESSSESISEDEIEEITNTNIIEEITDPDEMSDEERMWVEAGYNGLGITINDINSYEFRLKTFDLEDTCMIISRQHVGNVDISTKYGLTLNEANTLRINLTKDAMILAHRILTDERTSGEISIPNKTDEMYIGMYLIRYIAGDVSNYLGIDRYSAKLREIRHKYDLCLTNHDKWYDISELEDYKLRA